MFELPNSDDSMKSNPKDIKTNARFTTFSRVFANNVERCSPQYCIRIRTNAENLRTCVAGLTVNASKSMFSPELQELVEETLYCHKN